MVTCNEYGQVHHRQRDSKRAVQGACYNQLATTLYTPVACQQSRNQHDTCTVVCPRFITAVAFYLIPGSWLLMLSDPAISCPAGLCCCVIHACCHRYYNTDIPWRPNMITCAYDTNRMLYVFQFVLAPLPERRPGGELCMGVTMRTLSFFVYTVLQW